MRAGYMRVCVYGVWVWVCVRVRVRVCVRVCVRACESVYRCVCTYAYFKYDICVSNLLLEYVKF